MFLVVLDDFADDELQKSLGEIGIEIRLDRQIFEPRDLGRFARRIGRGKVVGGLEQAHRLSVLEPLTQRVDENRVQTVDGRAVFGEEFRGAGGKVLFGQIGGRLGRHA